MTYEEMKQQLDKYNWDDGFDIPKQILTDPNCDLALALDVFYLADGYAYLMGMEKNNDRSKKWICFVEKLYADINNGVYAKTNHNFEIPLSKVQCYHLRKKSIPDVFLKSIKEGIT